jgi:glyoxylase-like metal-dependent hydrolase (beta-lactamase superfamily II)
MLLQRSAKDDRTAKELAPGVFRIHEFAPVINAYIVEDVLIDSGRRWDRKRIFKALEGRDVSLVALTHTHGDHNGVAKDVCEARGVPLAVHADDVAVMERGGPTPEELADASTMARFVWRYWGGPATGSTGCWRRVTRSPASASSTPRATAPAR